MLNTTSKRNTAVKTICLALTVGSLLSAASASAQSQQETQRRTEEYYNHIKPQQDKAAAETAAILAKPSNWGPGEIRDAVNHGTLAWYEKSPGAYGYIFHSGMIRQSTADNSVMLECLKRKVVCSNELKVMNAWLVVGSYTNRTFFVTATAATREAAETLVHTRCRADGITCTIKDAFDVTPHPRGVSSQRIKEVVR